MTMQDATLCLLVRGHPPQEILLGLKKARFGAGKYNGFGGKVEDGETIAEATVREMREETGVHVRVGDLERVGHLTFLFPYRPEWEQVVHVFTARTWRGVPQESDEMAPAWFAVDAIPYDRMWNDDVYWMPRVLAGERVRATFTYRADNETVERFEIQEWDTELHSGQDPGFFGKNPGSPL
jgi:8-oxo-dGTP pyrophosphatase MutT (NUDIX family)